MRIVGFDHVAHFPLLAGVLIGATLAVLTPSVAADGLPVADALRIALATNPNVRVQHEQIDVARAQQLQAAGQFDFMLTSGVNYSKLIEVPAAVSAAQTKSFATGYQVGGLKQLRNGATVGIGVEASSKLGAGVAADETVNNAVTLRVTLAIPLLRGRGVQEVAAIEDSAKLNVLVSQQTLRDGTAQLVQQTLSAYWDYWVRVALRKVALNSEERSRQLLASNKKLVEAAEKPRADLVLLQADLADKVIARRGMALDVVNARNTLGRLMGLDALAISRLPEPTDSLPSVVAVPSAAQEQLVALRAEALNLRPDVLALAVKIEAAERQSLAARHQLLPKLDFGIGVSYAKVSNSSTHYAFIAEAGRLQTTPAVVARLSYEFPIQNNVANGRLAEHVALLTQLQIQQRDLASGVETGVENALEALTNSAEQLKVAREALASYELAVNQEMVKQKNGIATLIDVLNIEARFVSAQVSFLQIQLACANAITRLRYETGTLLPTPTGRVAQEDHFALDIGELSGLGPLGRFLTLTN